MAKLHMIKTIEIEDTGEFTVESASGWVQHLTYKRVATVGADRQEDVLAFKEKAQ